MYNLQLKFNSPIQHTESCNPTATFEVPTIPQSDYPFQLARRYDVSREILHCPFCGTFARTKSLLSYTIGAG